MKNEFELIICIVNEGFAESVMDAARGEGATGGTILSARGTANTQAETLFNITIEPHKDMILIVVKREITDNVLKAIYDKVGLSTEGKGVAFALPVEDTVGIK